MSSDSSPLIGLALDSALANALEAQLLVAGYRSLLLGNSDLTAEPDSHRDVALWIIDAQLENLYRALADTGKFILPAENPPSPAQVNTFAAWAGALIGEVDAALAAGSRQLVDVQAARDWSAVQAVWLLAGSAGASPAVQDFLNGFRNVPPVAFIYAQHFDPDKQDQLEQLTLENNRFTLHLGVGLRQLAQGRVLMIPPRCKVTLNSAGELRSIRAPWEGGHTPDINELLVIMAATALPARGVIFFSGMGDDGAANLPVFHASGAHIWAQQPAGAICSAMPQAAIDTGLVDRVESPQALAHMLEVLYER